MSPTLNPQDELNPLDPLNQRRRGRRTRGAISTLALLAMIPLVLTVGALLTTAVRHHRELEQGVARESTGAISTSGAQDALYRLDTAKTLSGTYDLPSNGGTAHVTATPWGTDGADNDSDGVIDDPDEEAFYALRSEGWLNALPVGGESDAAVQSFHATTDVLAEVIDFDFAFDQGIYIDDPAATIDLNGSAFELSGNDRTVGGGNGSDPARPAVGVNGDPQHVIDQVAGNQKTKIIGNLPNPAIGTTGVLVYDDYRAMLAPLAATQWTAPMTSYSGSDLIGDYANRVGIVTHATGNVNFHGTTTGAGVLIVDGDLEISGRFTFAGVILVRGNVSFKGGGGYKELYGALLVWGEDAAGPKDDLEVSGTVQISYSSEGLDIASTSGGARIHFWKQL